MSNYHLVDFHNEGDEPISKEELGKALAIAGFKLAGVNTEVPDRTSGLFPDHLKTRRPSLATLLFEETSASSSWMSAMRAKNMITDAVAPLNYITKYQMIYGDVKK